MKVIYLKEVGKIPVGRIAAHTNEYAKELIEKGTVKEYTGEGIEGQELKEVEKIKTKKNKSKANKLVDDLIENGIIGDSL